MKNPADLLRYLLTSVSGLIEAGQFVGGQKFKPTQKKALEAFYKILQDESLPVAERIDLFFTMPQGTGKTPLFVGVIDGAIKAAQKENASLKSMIVVPTTKLLYQTLRRFTEFAPGNESNIGLYGDGHEDRKKPITIITYKSWSKLVDEGRLTEDNVDILISDEAHRGTSKKRTDYIKEFSTASRMGFSATPKFNSAKGVAQTHGKEVFNSSFRESIELGELAAYFQALLFIIRVLPASREVVEKAKAEGLKNYESERRKKAWSERVVPILRETRDPQTGELISDSQGKVACRDIDHIKLTVSLINADPVLKAKATALGMEDFCVPMHSGLSKKTQRENQAAYERGEYQFIVSDEQLKEGWDYPPAKVLIDYHHFSYVDKAQILGRIGREWENPQMGRMEGAVAIDILTYTGHPDPIEDEKLRKEALKNAVLAWEVLEDVVVFGPCRKEAKENSSKIKDAISAVTVAQIIGQEVQAYTSLEDLRLVRAEQISLRLAGEYIDLTTDLKSKLKSEMDRTKISIPAMLGQGKRDNLAVPAGMAERPSDLTVATVSGWLHQATKARKEHFEWVVQFLSSMPDSNLIPVTEEIRKKIENLFSKAEISAGQLLRNCDDIPDGLYENKINRWLSGRSKEAEQEHVDYICNKLNAIIDGTFELGKLGHSHSKEGNQPISKVQLEELNLLSKKTGMSGTEILKYAENDKPEQLTRNIIESWKHGSVTNAKPELFEYAINLYKKVLADFESKGYDPSKVEVTPEMQARMLEWNKIVPNGVVSRSEGAPEDLDRSIIYCWLTGDAKTARKYHLDYALVTWPHLVHQKLLSKPVEPKI